MTHRVNVDLGDRSYPILVGSSLLESVSERIRQFVLNAKQFVSVYDENVASWNQLVVDRMKRDGLAVNSIAVASGEASKSCQELARLWTELGRLGLDRSSAVLAIGGGVIGDLAGFAAATYLRGIRLIQIPTTLLAQVDSSVGGKTGINLTFGKNLIGAFWQPSLVLADIDTLATLPSREFRSGLAEIIKYGMAQDSELFCMIEENVDRILDRDKNILTTVIARCCELKASVVAVDERETSGARALLNYGHTFGHAIESITEYRQYLHGEAVAIGMHLACGLAVRLGMCDAEPLERQLRLLQKIPLPTCFQDTTADRMMTVMMRDKKVHHGRIAFVLPSGIGNAKVSQYVDSSALRSYLVDCGFRDH